MKKLFNNKNGITLIALVITIVVLIILAAVAINLSLGNNGIFKRAKTAKEQYQNAQDYESDEVERSTNQIDVLSSSSRLTGGSGSKKIIWSTDQAGTREVNLNDYNCKITDFDFLLVYFNYNGGINDNLIIDTSKDYTMMVSYPLDGNNYTNIYVSTSLTNNKVTLTTGGNGWLNSAYLTTIIGINL